MVFSLSTVIRTSLLNIDLNHCIKFADMLVTLLAIYKSPSDEVAFVANVLKHPLEPYDDG